MTWKRSLHLISRGPTTLALTAAAAVLLFAGCDRLDPTEVDNPNTTAEDLAKAERPTQSLIPGLRAQFARALDPTIPEVVSDNYSIHGTGINKTNDFPRLITPELGRSFGASYEDAQELRALADFVLDVIAPTDTKATPELIQEAHYYRAMAFLLVGERFAAAPVVKDGAPVAWPTLVQNAVTDFEAARGGPFDVRAQAALARAHRLLGAVGPAETFAAAVLAADATFLFSQSYDAGTVSNNPFFFLVLRSLQEMQPLPRLDFLDPKFTTRESAIPVSKAEEMHLILAEAAFSRGDWATGREQVARAIEVAQARTRLAFTDNDPRLNEDLTPRPHDGSITVRADPSSPYRAGLVLTRPGSVNTPIVSGTSLVADSIRAIAVAQTESLLHALFLARQEILFLEGRRMTDLGIRLPVTLEEIETNPNISQGGPGTSVTVPSYIPPEDQMDLYDPASPYDAGGNLTTTQITQRFDLNRILAQNKVSPFGLP